MRQGKSKIVVSIILCIAVLVTSVVVAFSLAKIVSAASQDIVIHFDNEYSGTPYIYYWNSLPDNIEVEWPGKKMTYEKDVDGEKRYTITFQGKTKINFLFTDGVNQTNDLTVKSGGEWWYCNGKLYNKDPHAESPIYERTDFRDETIYFVITTRFYDGDSSNNTQCIDGKDQNSKADPPWRGDFKGLIEKLDYIKAMGFSAIWITPVVKNLSGYDYHGYHAVNFKEIDPRYESEGASYQDLIDACHKKGIKVIQDIVLNHTSSNGEENLFPLVEQTGAYDNFNTIKRMTNSKLPTTYDSEDGGKKHDLRYEQFIASAKSEGATNYYHQDNINFEGFTVTTGQFSDDCVDLNTENPNVYNYLIDAYNQYIDMGVDAFRIDTVKHISRLTFNKTFLPAFKKTGGDNFYMFGECAARVHEIWNHGVAPVSPQFFTWKENKEYFWSDNPDDTLKNCASTKEEFVDNNNVASQRTSDNYKLNGNDYHTPDYSEFSGMGMIDFTMHWNFDSARNAFNVAKQEDPYYNDSTWNVTYVDSHDYGPNMDVRYPCGTTAWAENLDLMFTFRGIPCIYYGSEVEFQAGKDIDKGCTKPLAETGRAYFGDYIEGSVNVTDYAEYSNATGTMADTLNSPLSKHIQRLNKIRRAIPALRKGQYSTEGVSGSGMAFKRRYTGEDNNKNVDSFVCVSISGGATFSGIPNGTYVDAITGTSKTVSNGTLSIESIGQANMRVYVLQNSSTSTGKIGSNTEFLK